MKKLGILHPGQMGISVAASAQNSGCQVYWASEGRSEPTRARAGEHGLLDAQSLEQLCQTCDILVSVCPPHAAEELAREVIAQGFTGIYCDANAIAPQHAFRIAALMNAAGIAFVDGGIIGGPAWEPGRTWLYLSGEQAGEIADCFSSGPLETSQLGDQIGKASALKMCFAAYTKGSTALLCAVLATSEELGVRADLEKQWSRNGSDFAETAQNRVRRVTAKAWRFSGEMAEIAATFGGAGIPGSFHIAAREIYKRMAGFKDSEELPDLEEVLAALLQNPIS